MADTTNSFSPEVLKAAKKFRVDPFEIEPCELCAELVPAATVAHEVCPKRPWLFKRYAFSPNGERKMRSPTTNAFTWRRTSGGAFSIGIATPADLIWAKFRRTPAGAARDALRDELQPLRDRFWTLKNIRAVAKLENIEGLVGHVAYEGGPNTSFQVHVWMPLVFGEEPKRAVPDVIEIVCEMHDLPWANEAAKASRRRWGEYETAELADADRRRRDAAG